MRKFLALAGLALGLLLGCGLGTASATEADLFWQCVAPASGTSPSWCPASTTYPLPVSVGALPSGTANIGNVGQISPYPVNAVPITASATGTTAATTATLTNVTGHTTYICGYSVRANATVATTVLDTVTGVITATMSSELWVAAATSGIGVDEQNFSPCIPASAVSTSIAVVSGAPGSGGVVSVNAWGYSL